MGEMLNEVSEKATEREEVRVRVLIDVRCMNKVHEKENVC